MSSSSSSSTGAAAPGETSSPAVAPVSSSHVTNFDTILTLTHAIGVNGALILLGLLLFHLLWSLDIFKGVLRPRTILSDDQRRQPRTPRQRWLSDVLWLRGDDLIDTIGLDAYFYLRYQWLAIKYFTAVAAICCPILIPYHMAGRAALGSNPNRPIEAFHFSELTLGNVPSGDRGLWLHVACAYVQAALLVFLLIREARIYAAACARYHLGATLTIQITSLPAEFQKDSALRRLLRRLAGTDEVRRSHVLRTPDGDSTPVAFVTMWSMAACARLLTALNGRGQRLHAVRAPLPDEIVWDNLAQPRGPVLARRVATSAVVVFMIVFWTVPMTAIASMGELLRDWPSLEGVLPAWAFLLLLTVTPPLLVRLAAQERHGTETGAHGSVFGKFTWILILDFFLFGTVSRGLVSTLWRTAAQPLYLSDLLASIVPDQSTIMIIYLLSFTCVTLPFVDLNRIVPTLMFIVKRCPAQESLPLFPYGEYYSYQMLHILMGYTYATLAPLMLPFVLIYFIIAAAVSKIQFVYVFGRREGGGTLFPAVLSRTLRCAVAGYAILMSVLLSKQGTFPALTLIPILAVLAVADVSLRRMCRSSRPVDIESAATGVALDREAYLPPWMKSETPSVETSNEA